MLGFILLDAYFCLFYKKINYCKICWKNCFDWKHLL